MSIIFTPMNEEHKKPDHDLALGQSIASVPEMRALKEEAVARLASGESRESVLACLLESVQGMTTDMERLVGMDQNTATWLFDWAETGEPGALDMRLRGTVSVFPWPDGEGGTVSAVMAVAGPTSDPEEIAEEFLRLCRKMLPHECFKTKVNPERDARWFRLHKEGLSYRKVAALYLKEEGFDQRSASDEDWKQELDAWTSRVTLACLRWQEHLTRLTDSM
jgi:hypothetical protein